RSRSVEGWRLNGQDTYVRSTCPLQTPATFAGARLCLSLLGTIHDCTLNIGLIELALLLLAWRTTLDFGWSARMASERSLSDALLSRCA
ncbi:hypothetical protein, partial [Burkholderia pseudomallei]|uniref:hypothetical protein n=1 Tax=Burkholderia pseudomallei TaxID=28450 RepID=UPI00194033E4